MTDLFLAKSYTTKELRWYVYDGPSPLDPDQDAAIALLDARQDADDLTNADQDAALTTETAARAAAITAEAAARDTAIAAALAAHSPGRELGYAERTSIFTTTNTTPGSAAAGSKVGSLSITLTGAGLPVLIQAYCGNVYNSVASQGHGVYLLMNSTQIELGVNLSTSTAFGPKVFVGIRKVLTAGVQYTFEVGAYGIAAGTTALGAGATSPAWLSVIGA